MTETCTHHDRIPTAAGPIELRRTPCRREPRWLSPWIDHALARLLRIRALNRLHASIDPADPAPFPDKVLAALGVRCDVPRGVLRRTPAAGPLLVVANHPFGAVEGLALASLIGRRRPDLRLLGNEMLGQIPEIRPQLIPIDVFATEAGRRRNAASLRAALRHLRGGGALAVFPAGEVSRWDWRTRTVRDGPWNPVVGRLARASNAAVLPVGFRGAAGPAFQLASLLHPRLGTLLLPHELLRRRGCIPVRVGRPLPPAKLEGLGPDEATEKLRLHTDLLLEPDRRRRPLPRRERLAPIAPPRNPDAVDAELTRLPACQRLAHHGQLEVWLARADQIPATLEELGRAREIAFRAAGEGSSGARDLDAFDAWYEQLVLYDRAHRAITGGYRLARVDEVLADRGVTGLYTYTLFDFDARLLREIGPALELGRSFVAPDAQRSFTPLLLLWKAIAAYVAREPRYRRLFGPVSIHAGYRDLSKRLMVSFLRHHLAAPDVAAWLRPRHPYRRPRRRATHLRRWSHVAASLEELDAIVTELEQGEAGVPVLLRQYLKLGAKPLGFNVDPRFASVLDALLLVDLVETDPRILGRYMGRVPLRAFRAFHGLGPGTGQAGPEPGAVAEPATPCLGAG